MTQLHDAGPHTRSVVLPLLIDSAVDDVGEGEATGGEEVSSVATDVGVGLGVSPDQASVSLLRYERGQGGPGQFALLVEGVVAQPASLGSLSQGGVAVSGHDVPGLQELACSNNMYYLGSGRLGSSYLTRAGGR